MGAGALDAEAVGCGERAVVAFEHSLQRLDFFEWPIGEVGEGPFAGAAAFAPALAQEHGGARVAVGHGVDIHGNILPYCIRYINIFNQFTWEHSATNKNPI